MFCKKCGAQLKDGAKFCAKCGTKIDIQPSAAENGGVQEQQSSVQRPASGQQQGSNQRQVSGRQQVQQPGQTQGPTGPRPASQPYSAARSGQDSAPVRMNTGVEAGKEKPEKKNHGLVAVLMVILILVLAAGGSVLFYISRNKGTQTTVEQEDTKKESGKKRDEEAEEQEQESDTEGALESGEEPTTQAAEAGTDQGLEEPTSPAAGNRAAGGPATGSVVYANQADFSGIYKVNIQKENVTQSTYLVQDSSDLDNTGWSAFDGQSSTSWQEGRPDPDDGIGDFVKAGFGREYQVKVITFLLGNRRSDDLYWRNNRPRTLTVDLGGQEFQAEFPDEMQEFALELSSPVAASDITVTVDSVYPGTDYHDTVISEIGVYGN